MSIDHFLTKTNVILMWELIDENSLQYKSYDIIKEIKILFDNNLIPFFEKEKFKTKNVMELNKKYISLILHYLNNNYSSSQDNYISQNNISPNNIGLKNSNVKNDNDYNEKQKELITYEDLQSDRLTHFEKQLSLKQQEFSFAMQSKVPETPNFKDNLDEPMREIDITMQRTIAQRNYDIEQLNQSLNQNKSIELKDNWLEPKETSIKNENIKLNQLQNQLPSQTQKYSQPFNKNSNQLNNIKFIKIHKEEINSNLINNDVILLPDNIKPKHITWEDQINVNPYNNEPLKLREPIKEKASLDNNGQIMEKLEFVISSFQLMNEQINDLNNKYNNLLEVIKKKND
jgi:hypothetical protein